MRNWLVYFFLVSVVFAGYTQSEKYRYSFYLPAKYHQEKIENDFGPFYQFRHPRALLFVHFWARPRPENADLEFLLEAYKHEFMKDFIDDEIPQAKKLDKALIKGAAAYRYKVTLLEQNYNADVYLAAKGKLFYCLVFYYQPNDSSKVDTDISTLIYSFTYGY